VDLLHYASPIFPLRNPAIISMPAGFLAGIVASLLTRDLEAEERFNDEKLRTYLGMGAE
jgi:cation/acetate symporter